VAKDIGGAGCGRVEIESFRQDLPEIHTFSLDRFIAFRRYHPGIKAGQV